MTATAWTPNRLEYDVQLNAPAILVVNQNYETGWRADDRAVVGAFVPGGPRLSHDVHAHGLLAVELPAGTHHLVLRHRPPGLWLGAILTALGMLLSVAALQRRRVKLLS